MAPLPSHTQRHERRRYAHARRTRQDSFGTYLSSLAFGSKLRSVATVNPPTSYLATRLVTRSLPNASRYVIRTDSSAPLHPPTAHLSWSIISNSEIPVVPGGRLLVSVIFGRTRQRFPGSSTGTLGNSAIAKVVSMFSICTSNAADLPTFLT